jgi:hypothetical protein
MARHDRYEVIGKDLFEQGGYDWMEHFTHNIEQAVEEYASAVFAEADAGDEWEYTILAKGKDGVVRTFKVKARTEFDIVEEDEDE